MTKSMKRHEHSAVQWWRSFCTAAGIDHASKVVSTEAVLLWVTVSLRDGEGEDRDNNNPKYMLTTFQDCYLPAWFRWLDRMQFSYSHELKRRIGIKIRQMVANDEIGRDQMPDVVGSNPFCYFDLKHVLSVLPATYPNYEQHLGWAIVGIEAGPRAISRINMRWCHLDVVVRDEADDGNHLVEINIRWEVGKGQCPWGHSQTLEGRLFDRLSAIFWFQAMWKLHCNDDAATIVGAKLDDVDAWVFDLPEDRGTLYRDEESQVYRRGFQELTFLCGYPADFFSNHSTRSGFEVAAYLHHATQDTSKAISDIWTAIALSVGYDPESRQRAMHRYFLNRFRNVKVSSRLVGRGACVEPEEVQNIIGVGEISLGRLNPLSFHGLDNLTPRFQDQSHTKTLSTHVTAMVNKHFAGSKTYGRRLSYRYLHELYCHAPIKGRVFPRKAGLAIASVLNKKASHELLNGTHAPPSIWLRNAVFAVGERLQKASDNRASRADGFNGFKGGAKMKAYKLNKPVNVRKLIMSAKSTKHAAELKRLAADKRRREEKNSTVTKRRKRAKWTDVEDAVLAANIEQYGIGKWREISRDPRLLLRSNVACKDRYRTWCKDFPDHDTETDVLAARDDRGYTVDNKRVDREAALAALASVEAGLAATASVSTPEVARTTTPTKRTADRMESSATPQQRRAFGAGAFRRRLSPQRDDVPSDGGDGGGDRSNSGGNNSGGNNGQGSAGNGGNNNPKPTANRGAVASAPAVAFEDVVQSVVREPGARGPMLPSPCAEFFRDMHGTVALHGIVTAGLGACGYAAAAIHAGVSVADIVSGMQTALRNHTVQTAAFETLSVGGCGVVVDGEQNLLDLPSFRRWCLARADIIGDPVHGVRRASTPGLWQADATAWLTEPDLCFMSASLGSIIYAMNSGGGRELQWSVFNPSGKRWVCPADTFKTLLDGQLHLIKTSAGSAGTEHFVGVVSTGFVGHQTWSQPPVVGWPAGTGANNNSDDSGSDFEDDFDQEWDLDFDDEEIWSDDEPAAAPAAAAPVPVTEGNAAAVKAEDDVVDNFDDTTVDLADIWSDDDEDTAEEQAVAPATAPTMSQGSGTETDEESDQAPAAPRTTPTPTPSATKKPAAAGADEETESENDEPRIVVRGPSKRNRRIILDDVDEVVYPRGKIYGRNFKVDGQWKMFWGMVTDTDFCAETGKRMYRVVYEDGDQEDVYHDEFPGGMDIRHFFHQERVWAACGFQPASADQ